MRHFRFGEHDQEPHSWVHLRSARTLIAIGLPIASAGLVACAQPSHQSGDPDEQLDELRVIAATARAQATSGEASVCVARLVEGDPAFNALASTDLTEIRAQIERNPAPASDGSASSRTLDDVAIRAAIDRVELGPSCTGLTFLAFQRIQFRGDVAVASAFKTDGARCRGRGRVLFRLRRADGGWTVAQTSEGNMNYPIVCDAPTSETWSGYFAVRR